MKGIYPVEYLENYPGSIGDRMKIYESNVGTSLDKAYPVMLRVDGKAFKTYTAHFTKPFDDYLFNAMKHTATIMCSEIQGAKIAYSQSDEISVMLTAYENEVSTLWFDGRVQKIVSNAASIATEAFNEYMDINYWPNVEILRKRARFDARCFNLPFVEVNNYFVWRQRDAKRNSILSMGQSQKDIGQSGINNLNTTEIIDLLKTKDIDWNELQTIYKLGYCIKREHLENRSPWVCDENIPNFGIDKDYINNMFEKELLI